MAVDVVVRVVLVWGMWIFVCCLSGLHFWCLLCFVDVLSVVFFFKQKTAYELRISDWSSDVCSSDLSSPSSERPPQRPRWPRSGSASASPPTCTTTWGKIGRASCRERVCQYV